MKDRDKLKTPSGLTNSARDEPGPGDIQPVEYLHIQTLLPDWGSNSQPV